MNTNAKLIPIPKINMDPFAGWNIAPKYKFIRLLGYGSYGSVCLAVNLKTELRVAIKKFTSVFEDTVKCKRILREIEILYSIDNPNIVKPLDVFMKEGSDIYLVIEIAQIDLLALARSSTFLVDSQVRIIMYRLLVALNFLHSGGIIHRDIKPANILINHDCTIKICDFSLGRSIIGLASSKFDCGLMLRRFPSLKLPEDSDDEAMFKETDEGEKTVHKTAHCDFLVNLEKIKYKTEYQEKIKTNEDIPTIKDLIETQKKETRTILLTSSKAWNHLYGRELTGHIATRWYRPPEIILIEKVYTTAVDMWSAGCVFAELLGMIEENQPVVINRSALFPGKSCFPLSPPENPTQTVIGMPTSPQDQLRMILGVFGHSCPPDLSFLNDQRAEDYVKALSEIQARTELRKRLPAADENTMDLLKKLLSFNPYYRITAKEALAHPYFKKVRNKKLELEIKEPVTLLTDTEKTNSLQILVNVVLNKVLKGKD
jgi:mitogen-activated protein kinase 1/3